MGKLFNEKLLAVYGHGQRGKLITLNSFNRIMLLKSVIVAIKDIVVLY